MSDRQQFLYVLQPTRLEMVTEAPTEAETEVVGRHFRYLQQLAAEGIVLMAGRTSGAGEDTMGLVVFEAADLAEARRVMEADPAVAAGVMAARVHPYLVAVTGGAFAGKDPA